MRIVDKCKLVAVSMLGAAAAGPLYAEPVKLEALIATKAQSKLELADGSKRYLIALQREGRADGNGPLAGTTMLEWGVHDVTPGAGADGHGYLVFTRDEGEVAYLKYRFRATPATRPDGKPTVLLNGFWEVAGGTGDLKGLRGAGTVRIDPVSAKQRRWLLEGDMSIAAR
jgi:hypothetical protein